MFATPNRVNRFATISATLLFWAVGLSGATLVQLSVSDMITQSTSIEHATVVSSWAAASGPIIYTHYKLQVTELLKGPGIQEIMVFGGSVNGNTQIYAGAPQLKAGEDYVFFLYTNNAGLTYITGLTQGLFSVAQDGSVNPAVTRSASLERMLDPKTGHQIKDQTLSLTLKDLKTQISNTLYPAKVGK